MPTSAFLIVTGRQTAFGALTALALGLNIAANLALIPVLGALGAALASLASMALLASLQLGLCWNTLRGPQGRAVPG